MFAPRRKLEALAEAELHRLRLVLRDAVVRIVVVLCAGFLMLVAMTLGAAALAFALSDIYGAPVGTLITAGVVLVIAVVLALLGDPLGRSRERRFAMEESQAARRDLANDLTTATSMANHLRGAAPGASGFNAKPLVFGALTAGFVVGFSPRLQRAVFGGRKPAPRVGD